MKRICGHMKITSQTLSIMLLLLLITSLSGCNKDEQFVSKLYISPQNLFFGKDSVETVTLSVQPPQPFEWNVNKLPQSISLYPPSGSSKGEDVELTIKRDIVNQVSFAYQEIDIVTNIAGAGKILLASNGYIYDCISIIPDTLHFGSDENRKRVYVKFKVDYPNFNRYYIVFEDDWIRLYFSTSAVEYSQDIEMIVYRNMIPEGKTYTYMHLINSIFKDTTSFKITIDTIGKGTTSKMTENVLLPYSPEQSIRQLQLKQDQTQPVFNGSSIHIHERMISDATDNYDNKHQKSFCNPFIQQSESKKTRRDFQCLIKPDKTPFYLSPEY